MARVLNSSLSYLGVEAKTPPDLTILDRAPLTKDYKQFDLGDIWLEKNSVNVWMLTGKQLNAAVWTDISSSGNDTFTSVTITSGNLTLQHGSINVTLGNITISAGDLILPTIVSSTLRTDSSGKVIGLADPSAPTAGEGTVYHSNDAGVAKWGNITSTGTTVTISTTATGINLEAAGGTAAGTFTADDGNAASPSGAGNIILKGGTSISTKSIVANTVTFDLDDSITVTTLNATTVAATTVNSTTVNATTFDTNVAAAGLTLAGNTLAADGSDTDVNIDLTPQAAGVVKITTLGVGAVLSSATGALSSSPGTIDYALISNGGSAVPSWQPINDYAFDINLQTGTIYTLILTDRGKEIQLNNASAIALTIPTNASVNFPVGTQVLLVQYGAGTVTVSPAGGVTLNSISSKTSLYEQYSGAALVQQALDEWILIGDIR